MSYYRMPVGFGPSLGPRQGPDGRKFNGELYRSMHVAVETPVDGARLAKVLPPGYEPAANPVVRIQTNFIRDVPWLAGRAYNFAEVLFSVVFRGEKDVVEGELVAVMWENMADPIISGREEIGLPKLFADIPELEQTDDGMIMRASWCGFEFLTTTCDGLKLEPWPSGREAEAETVQRATGGSTSPQPRLYYKYMPRTGQLDTPEVAYTTMTPPGNYQMKVLDSWTGSGRICFRRARWEDLPTMCQIVNGMVDLQVEPHGTARVSRQVVSFNDLADQVLVLK